MNDSDLEQNIADIFCKAAKSQKSIDDVLKNIVRDLYKHDKDTREVFKGLQREVFKEDWKSHIRKIGFGGWTLLVILITAIVQGIIRKYLG